MQRFFVAVSQVLGRRIVLFAAVGIFTVGTAVSCISPVFPVLLVGRSLQGIGSGGMVSVPLAILTDTVPAHRRSGYNGIILLVSAIGALVGPVVGGVFMERHFSWLWVFYISLPICAVLLTSVPIIVRPVGEQLSPRQRLLSIDWTGGTLFTVSMVSCLLGVTWYGREDPSKRWPTLIALGAGAAGIVGTMLYEKMGASQPFFPFPIVKKSSATFICIYLHGLLVSQPS
jgi:MFS family permease